MADANSTGRLNSSLEIKGNDIRELHEKIKLMDSISQAQCGEIEAVASTALIAMRSAEFWRHSQRIEGVLSAILARAQDLKNTLNVEAEEVGCNHIDTDERERRAAFSESYHRRAPNV